MADEIDLETGDPTAAEETPRRSRRRRERSGESSGKSDSAAGRINTEIRSRLDRVFDRIAKALEARDDQELADVIREDSEAMTQGFVSLTSSFTPLRLPLLMILNLVEPLLAFGRVGRILFTRWAYRRAERQAQREADMAAQQFAENGGAEVPAV